MAEAAAASGRFVGIDLGVNCVVASSPEDDRNCVSINTNDVSGRSTPSAVSFDGKLRLVGVQAEGRAMSAPKQTITGLPLALGGAELTRKRKAKYLWGYGVEDDGKLGPFTFNDEDFSVAPCGPLSALLRTLSKYALQDGQKATDVCVAVPDALSEAELGVVKGALSVAGLNASLLRHSDAVAVAFVQNATGDLLPEATPERVVGFVDIGVSHGTISVVKYSRAAAPAVEEGSEPVLGEIQAEFLYRRSEELLGVQALIAALVDEAKTRIETKHKCTVKLQGKAGMRLTNEAVHTLKQLSMLPDAELALEAFMPEGPEGPEIDIQLAFTRTALEAAASKTLDLMRDVLKEAMAAAPGIEGVEIVGGGSRVPAVQALIKESAGEEVPLRFGLDGASCVASGAAAWAAGRRMVPAAEVAAAAVVAADVLASIKEREDKMDLVDSQEVQRLDCRNTLESYVYKVRDWLSSKNGSLLKPDVMGPFLDKTTLWFEDCEMAEEPTSLEVYQSKLKEVEDFVKTEGAAFFEAKAKEKEDQEKALEEAAIKERARRKELGMDDDKDDRHMKKEDRLRLAAKNKDEGNDMFKAQKYDDAIRRYKKAIDHVSRPEAVSNMTPDEADQAKKLKVSCHLNSAQCYLKAADTAFASGGKNSAEPFYKKARTSCDDVLDLDAENIKAMFRRSMCFEKIGDLDAAMKDIKKALKSQPEDTDLLKSQVRVEKLLAKQKEGQKKVFSKMFG